MESVFRVCIAWYEHERDSVCIPKTKSRVCLTIENSPNPLSVHNINIELIQQGQESVNNNCNQLRFFKGKLKFITEMHEFKAEDHH